jgi:cytoplasmic iron level regulating protein YaaA (DUF328/UPF0246 family)
MLLLLSPAKTLDFETPVPAPVRRRVTEPAFAQQAAALVQVMARKPAAEVAALMELSPTLAELNAQRYRAWTPEHTPANSRAAVLAFAGDVYEGLQAGTLATTDLAWAQEHVVILSGLYGALRPLDALQPYRLEMGTALATPRGRDLYAFWGDTVAAYLNERLASERAPVVVNLASQEYSRAALRPALQAKVVECVFEDFKPGAGGGPDAGDGGGGGGYKIISFFAKRARGLMARHAILKRARSPKALLDFAAEGYAHAPEVSTPQRLVFRRRQG